MKYFASFTVRVKPWRAFSEEELIKREFIFDAASDDIARSYVKDKIRMMEALDFEEKNERKVVPESIKFFEFVRQIEL